MLKAVSRFVSSGTPSQTPARSFAAVGYKVSADAVSKAVTLLVTLGAARVLPTDAFGVLALAMTTGWILGVASDAGLPIYLARAVARTHTTDRGVVPEVMRLRLRLAVAAVAVGVVVGLVWMPAYAAAFSTIVAAQIAGAVLETVSHVYRGMGRSEIESTLTIAQRLVTALLAAVVLIISPTLVALSVVLVLPPVVALIVSLAVARRLLGDAAGPDVLTGGVRQSGLRQADRPTVNRPIGGAFMRDAAPLGVAALVSALYFRCDLYFVQYWHGLEAVATYNAAFRLVEALRLLPAAALAVWFPQLCRARNGAPLTRLSTTLAAAGALLAVITFAAAPQILQLAYGSSYQSAAPALHVLALSLPLFFFNYALTHQVIAWDGQHHYLRVTFLALAANVIANVLLIPRFALVGAAWSTLLTELVLTAGCLAALTDAPQRLHATSAQAGLETP